MPCTVRAIRPEQNSPARLREAVRPTLTWPVDGDHSASREQAVSDVTGSFHGVPAMQRRRTDRDRPEPVTMPE